MTFKTRISMLLVVLAFGSSVGMAGAGGVPTETVLTSPHGEFQPAVGSDALAWERNTRQKPRRFNVYARVDGTTVKVNAGGTQAANGGIDGTTLAYQQYAGNHSDIKIFDLATGVRRDASELNTDNWEYWPSVSGGRYLFGRLTPSGTRRIILFDTNTGTGRTLALSETRSRFLAPGQINGDFATWSKCTPNTCNVWGYQISTGEQVKIPNPGRFQRASSVGPDGTVYFVRSEEECGLGVRLMAYQQDGTIKKLTQLPDGRDINDTYVMSDTPGSNEVFYENSDCDTAHRSDIFKVVHVSDLELTVTKAGEGSGTIVSDPAGIDCGDECSALFDAGTQVTLTATAGQGSTFLGWNGEGCSGTGTCTVTMDEVRSVIANFEGPPASRTLTIVKSGDGTGTVTSTPAGINCGTDCTEGYPHGTNVLLTANPTGGSTFVGWSGGGCAGSGSCSVSMTEARNVTATFTRVNSLNVNRTGDGLVTSNPSGINCGGDCSETYPLGTVVTLSAFESPGWTFNRWEGACTGSGQCQVTMSEARVVTAVFDPELNVTIASVAGGTGTVTSAPAGISCPSDCQGAYPLNSPVTLTAAPSADSLFTSWSGNCTPDGADPKKCTVTMDQAKTVTATFTMKRKLTVDPEGTGTGTVTSAPAGISCGGDCEEDYAHGTNVVLTAAPDAGSTFSGWSGNCTPDGADPNKCTVTMDAAKTVTATFTQNAPPPEHTLNVSLVGDGQGSVDSSPAGIDCSNDPLQPPNPGDCTEDYVANTPVELTATPALGSTFTGWSGDVPATCSGTGPCTVTMDQARNVTATFDGPDPAPRQQRMGFATPTSVWQRLFASPSGGPSGW